MSESHYERFNSTPRYTYTTSKCSNRIPFIVIIAIVVIILVAL